MELTSKIYVAGHRGLLGSAVMRRLQSLGYHNLITATRDEVDLLSQEQVDRFLERERPEFVFLCAAKVGGILANRDHPLDFLHQNLVIQNHVMGKCLNIGVKKLMFVSSSCVYPTDCPIPIQPSTILTGSFEPTNEGYALAKVAGMRMCQYARQQAGADFITAIPCNLFGINDHYELGSSHLLPALIHKVHAAMESGAKELEVWGSGKPRREFMNSDECADALVFLMNEYSGDEPVNVGLGEDLSIKAWAEQVMESLGADLEIRLDPSKPDGIYRKLLDVSVLKELGWRSSMSHREAIGIAHGDFLERFWKPKLKS